MQLKVEGGGGDYTAVKSKNDENALRYRRIGLGL